MDVYCSCHFGKQCLLTLFVDTLLLQILVVYVTLHAR